MCSLSFLYMSSNASAVLHLPAALVKRRVASVEILRVQVLLGTTEGVCKPLVMHDLALAKVLDGVSDVGVIHQAQNVVVGGSRLLLCCQVLVEVGDDVSLDGDGAHGVREACGRCGVNSRGVVDEIRGEGAAFNFAFAEPLCQLIENGRHHLQMRQFLRS